MKNNDILKALKNVIDPEIKIPLLDLNMIDNIQINNNIIELDLKLTTSICPLKDTLNNSIKNAISSKFPHVKVIVHNNEMSNQEKIKTFEIIQKYNRQIPQALNNKSQNFSNNKLNKNLQNFSNDIQNNNSLNNSNDTHNFNQEQEFQINAKKIIGISSGKGGVGKSMLTALFAVILSNKGKKVGILDADIYGYSMANIFNINQEAEVVNEKLIPIVKNNIHIMSMGLLTNDNEAVLLRGPLTHRLLQQFITDVKWPKLDYLLIDLPPGTGDIAISLSQLLKKIELLIVTTPNENASNVAKRTGVIAKKTKQKIIGVIENMSYLLIDGKEKNIFGSGGGTKLSFELSKLINKNIPLICNIPIVPNINIELVDNNKTIKNNLDKKLNFELKKVIKLL